MQMKQSYFNIVAGVIISVLVAMILGAFGWITKMQATVNKADLALRELEQLESESMRKNEIYHRRLSENAEDIKVNSKTALQAMVQSDINFQLYLKEHD